MPGQIAMRCAGFDRVDIKAAKAFGISVARVPAYIQVSYRAAHRLIVPSTN